MLKNEGFGDVTLWLDDSPESLEARSVVAETGISFVEKIVTDPAEREALCPPTLQLYTHRLSGLVLIKAVSTNRHLSLQRQIDSDRERAQTQANIEDALRTKDPNVSFNIWPNWSPRYKE